MIGNLGKHRIVGGNDKFSKSQGKLHFFSPKPGKVRDFLFHCFVLSYLHQDFPEFRDPFAKKFIHLQVEFLHELNFLHKDVLAVKFVM